MLTAKKTLKDRPWLLLFAEFIIVILSVLIALGLDSWRENSSVQKIADNALQNFEREILVNQAEIQQAFDHHTILMEEIRNGKLGVSMNVGTIENSAWEVVQSTGSVTNIDFETVEKASRIYELQRRYQIIDESTSNIIYQVNFQLAQTGLDDLDEELLQSALLNLVIRNTNMERTLLEAYDIYLE